MSRSILVLSAAALSIAAPGCAQELERGALERPIIGGEPVEGDALPTVGAITTNIGSICTGTLIAPTVVLTAAHCVEPTLLKQSAQAAGQTPPDEIIYKVTFARDLRAATPDDFLEVSSVVWHEEFLADLEAVFTPGVSQWNDIALVHLAQPVEDRPLQRPAPTDVVEALAAEQRPVAVAGYGLTDDSDETSAGVLTAGQSALDELGEFEILAGEGDAQQACRGDSGGPIFADDSDTYQIGIASRLNANLFPPPTSPPPCNTGLLYTRVDTYAAWIEQNAGGEVGGPDDGEGGGDDGDDGDDGSAGGEDGSGGEDIGDGDEGGCAAAGGTSPLGFALLVALALLPLRRRRR